MLIHSSSGFKHSLKGNIADTLIENHLKAKLAIEVFLHERDINVIFTKTLEQMHDWSPLLISRKKLALTVFV